MNDRSLQSASQRLADVGVMAGRLIRLLNEEHLALTAGRTADIAALQDEKAMLIAAYDSAVRTIAKNPAAFAEVDPTLRAEVKAMGEALMAKAAENARLLAAQKAVHERVLAIVTEELQAQSPSRVYSRHGRLQDAAHPARVALDRTL